ncbi:MAG: thioredoxin family protein [Paracoccaceae bacterium]
MKRREFIVMASAAAALPSLVQAGGAVYTPGLAKAELDAGKIVFLDFTATWCGTCQRQGRIIAELQASNPDYEANISFIDVDWDDYGNGDLSNELKIPRRSTLVVLQGKKELGRIVAGTSKKAIQQLMDIALNAAVA